MSLTAIRNNTSLWNQNVISGRGNSGGGDGEGDGIRVIYLAIVYAIQQHF